MLDPLIKKRLESLRKLPAIPIVVSQILRSIDDPNVNSARIAELIEKDQSLTARVLRVANSPFYGFARRISTIDLAVVVMGTNAIKEILISMIVQRFFRSTNNMFFDIQSFWQYSMFSGAASRYLARKLGYKLAGEAFVTGLMHDIGILIIADQFMNKYKKIMQLVANGNFSLIEAEQKVLNSTHCDIGAWIANKWNLPSQIVAAIQNHHTRISEVDITDDDYFDFSEVDQPLTAIVSMSEWLADLMGYKNWTGEVKRSKLYVSKEVLDDISEHDVLEPGSAFQVIKNEIKKEYERASFISSNSTKPLYSR